MTRKSNWENREIECPEEKQTANILLEWQTEKGSKVLQGVCCDNPKLRDLDNWECKWSCWEKIAGQ